jgi:hypothetical protein
VLWCSNKHTRPPRDHGALHCHWTAIATKPIGQCVSVQTLGILHGPEEQSRPRGGTSIGITKDKKEEKVRVQGYGHETVLSLTNGKYILSKYRITFVNGN